MREVRLDCGCTWRVYHSTVMKAFCEGHKRLTSKLFKMGGVMKENMKVVIPSCVKCPAMRRDTRLPNLIYCAVSGYGVEVKGIALSCPFRKFEVKDEEPKEQMW